MQNSSSKGILCQPKRVDTTKGNLFIQVGPMLRVSEDPIHLSFCVFIQKRYGRFLIHTKSRRPVFSMTIRHEIGFLMKRKTKI
jgi:hypothetical protein